MPGFVPDPAVLVAFGLATVMLTLTPGPDMALFVSRAIHHGRAHGLAALGGALTGLVIHSFLAALGISVLLAAAPAAFTALKIGGALYLLHLALAALRGGGRPRIAGPHRDPPKLASSYFAGLAINLLNPKIVLFFVTFLPQFVSPDDPHAAGKLFFLGIEFIVVALPFVLAIVLAADRGRRGAPARRTPPAPARLGFRVGLRRLRRGDPVHRGAAPLSRFHETVKSAEERTLRCRVH